jgi:hypothetical protein
MRPPVQHDLRPCNSIGERTSLDLLKGFDIVLSVQKMAAIKVHGVGKTWFAGTLTPNHKAKSLTEDNQILKWTLQTA